MTAPPAESFVENRQGRHQSGQEVEFPRADERERRGQNQKKYGRAEELLRGKWLRRGGDEEAIS